MDKMRYKEGYEYQLAETYVYETGIFSNNGGGNDWVYIEPSGRLTILKGYAWDGPSGPALHTKDFLRGSLVHDALYQLIRTGVLYEQDQEKADLILKAIVLEDGMNKLRAWWVHTAVKNFGGVYIKNRVNDVLEAP